MVEKGESSGEQRKKEKKMKQGVFREEYEELEILVVENHRLYFDITQILNVVLGLFSTKPKIML